MPRISIPTPCSEDLSAMSLTERGRFCSACQKNIFDFRKGNRQDFERIVTEAPQGEVCGIVPTQWLANATMQRVSGNAFLKLQRFVLAILLAFGPGIFGLPLSAKAEMRQEILSYFDTTVAVQDGGKKIVGRVLDEYDNAGVQGAFVSLICNGMLVERKMVDEEGYFELWIPDSLIESGEWRIEVEWLGQVFPVKPDLNDEGILMLPIQAEILLPEVAIEGKTSYLNITGVVTKGVPVETMGNFFIYHGRIGWYYGPYDPNNRFQPTLEERILMLNSEVISKDF